MSFSTDSNPSSGLNQNPGAVKQQSYPPVTLSHHEQIYSHELSVLWLFFLVNGHAIFCRIYLSSCGYLAWKNSVMCNWGAETAQLMTGQKHKEIIEYRVENCDDSLKNCGQVVSSVRYCTAMIYEARHLFELLCSFCFTWKRNTHRGIRLLFSFTYMSLPMTGYCYSD